MFEVPQAKRVRRDELYHDSSSDGGSGGSHVDAAEEAEVRAKLNTRLSNLLGLSSYFAYDPPVLDEVPRKQEVEPTAQSAGEQETQEDEFEFRLFSTTNKAAAPTKVILSASDDEDARGEGAFVRPARPINYYLAGEPTPEQREMYRLAAVTGEDVLKGAQKRAWGLEVPWRVTWFGTNPAKRSNKSAKSTQTTTTIKGEEASEKRKRPGKKRRIAMRIKAKVEKQKEEQKLTKEEHLKEKKKRLNREKKLKRRQKEKEKKQAQGGGGPSEAADSSSDEGSTK